MTSGKRAREGGEAVVDAVGEVRNLAPVGAAGDHDRGGPGRMFGSEQSAQRLGGGVVVRVIGESSVERMDGDALHHAVDLLGGKWVVRCMAQVDGGV